MQARCEFTSIVKEVVITKKFNPYIVLFVTDFFLVEYVRLSVVSIRNANFRGGSRDTTSCPKWFHKSKRYRDKFSGNRGSTSARPCCSLPDMALSRCRYSSVAAGLWKHTKWRRVKTPPSIITRYSTHKLLILYH